MFFDEFTVIDPEASLWDATRPLLNRALQLDQQDEDTTWHGWGKATIESFLKRLPSHCTLLLGVWDVDDASQNNNEPRESLAIGCVCEVRDGAICTVRTFEALSDATLPAIQELEPGFQHAFDLIHVARVQIAPVAWALFTDKTTWNEWLLGEDLASDKGASLATLAQQGRCVLLGSQTSHAHHIS